MPGCIVENKPSLSPVTVQVALMWCRCAGSHLVRAVVVPHCRHAGQASAHRPQGTRVHRALTGTARCRRRTRRGMIEKRALREKKKLFSSEMCVTGNRKQCQVVARPAALQHNRLVWIHPHNTMNMMYLSVESVFLQCVLCAAVCCVIKRIKIAQNKLLVAYFVTGGLLLKVICNGFSQNWWKVVSSCLL